MANQIEYIKDSDLLFQGTKKINDFAIDPANRAEINSENAIVTSDEAKVIAEAAESKSDSTQVQLDAIVIEGDSSVEAAQARENGDGLVYSNLRNRINTEIGKPSFFRAEDSSLIDKMSNEFHERGLNIIWYGALGDGISNSSPALKMAIDEIGENEGTIVVPSGNFLIADDILIPENVKISFLKGGKIIINESAVLKIDGTIEAGDYEIFVDDGGKLDKHNSASPYNISWYSGDTINKKYDFARRDFEEFKNKIVIIPKPVSGQPGTYDDGRNRIYWACDGEMLIDDFGNASEWHINGEFIAISDFDSFIKVKGANKPENVYFYGTLQVFAPTGKSVKIGINIVEGARINFYDQVVINGCETSIVLGGDGQIAPSTAFFNLLQCSFYKINAIKIDGRNVYPNSIDANIISITSAQQSGTDAIFITGLVRDFKIGKILYAADSKDGFVGYEAENVIHIQSYGDKSVRFGLIESIFTTQASNAIKISDLNNTGNGDRIQFITVDRIYKKYDGTAFKINHCTDVTISRIFNSGANSTSVIGAAAVATEVLNNGGEKISDSGLYSVIGNVGKQTRGGGVPPAPALNWKIGTFILETTDNRLYLRVSKNGTAADFILIN